MIGFEEVLILIICIEVNISYLVATHKDIKLLYRAVDTFLFNLVADSIDMGLPSSLVSSLVTHLNCILIFIVIPKQSVHSELIFEAHWECFILVREIDKNIFFVLLS